MPKSTKKSRASRDNFYHKYSALAVPQVHASRSNSVPRSPFVPHPVSVSRTPSAPRTLFKHRDPSPRFMSVPCAPSVPRTPSIPRTPSSISYVPQSIREPNSYGPRSQKYDKYIELFDFTDDSDTDTGSRKKDPKQEKLPKSKTYELETIHQKPTHEPVKPRVNSSKPILHCYNVDTTNKETVNNPLMVKKSAPIKKISFVLPGCKKPLDSEHMDWKDFHKLNVIYKFMDDLEADFPSICTTTAIGKSVEGRDLKVLKISNSNASNVSVWIDAGVHAREWIAPAVNTYIANHISRNFNDLPESVTNKDWYFLPVVNPDGYHYSHTVDRFWRKNRALHNGLRSGVDLNRNFGVGWGRRGSSDKPQNVFYRGPHPFSEPESRAVRDMLLNSGIKFKVYITLHSYGQIIIFPYSFTSDMAPDYVHLLEGATVMSKAIYNTYGSTYKVGISRDVMYSASGTSNDFAHGGAGIPYCYLIELRSKQHKFRLPKEQIEETGEEILNSVLALLEFIDSYTYQETVEQNIDLLLKNDSFLRSSYTNIKKHSCHKSKYPLVKKSDSPIESKGSYVRLTRYNAERDEDTSDTDSVNESVLKKNSYSSTKQTNPYKKYMKKENQYFPDSSDSENELILKSNLKQKANLCKKLNEYLNISSDDQNESILKKSFTCDKETNPFKKVNKDLPQSIAVKNFTSEKETEYRKNNLHLLDSSDGENEFVRHRHYPSENKPDSYNKENQHLHNENESIRNKNYIPEMETDLYKKNNQHLPDSFDDENEPVLKKIYSSEKETKPYKKVNRHLHNNSSDKSIECILKNNSYFVEKQTDPYKKIDEHWPESIGNKNQCILIDSDALEKETQPYKKINESDPDYFDIRDEPVPTMNRSEKEINVNKNLNQYLFDSLDNEKNSDTKEIYTSRNETNPFNQVNLAKSKPRQDEPAAYSGNQSARKVHYVSEKELNLNKKINQDVNTDEKEPELKKIFTSEKETEPYQNDSSVSLLMRNDSFENIAETTKCASPTEGCENQPSSLADKQDSFEAWSNFYEQKNNFDLLRSHLLQKTTDIKCILSAKASIASSSHDLVKKQTLTIWKEERSAMDIMVEGTKTAQIATLLIERDIPYTIAVPDLNAILNKEQNDTTVLKTQNTPAPMDWTNYHTLETIYAFMDNLQAEYPYLCSVEVIGKSVEGRDLKMLKISNGEKTNHGVWMDGAIHPREWISPAVVTYLADRIVRTFNEMPECVTNKDWYVLPVLNPDGYVYTHTHDRMWRKNRARYGECVGVDLNRNFSYGYAEKGEEGSSHDPGSVFYRGPKAFSEPETSAVRRTISNAPTKFKAFLSFHSYGEVIIFPWGYTSDSCPDYVDLLEGGTAMAKAIYGTSGHTYKVGSTKDLMYYAAGTSIDWSYAVPNIPYSYMIELRSKVHRFILPRDQIIPTCKEIENGVFRLMGFIDQKCTGTQTCACPK